MTRVAACQIRLDIEDQAGTRARVLETAERAAADADLVVLPELAPTGYVFADATEARALAEPIDGRFVSALRDIARRHGCVVVAGIPEPADDRLYNSAVTIDRGTLLGVHRKVHLWGTEAQCFTPGDAPVAVLDTSAGRLGVLVCYDLEFPEYVSAAARAGAQLVVAPVNWPSWEAGPAGERPIGIVRAQAVAAMNRVVVVVADRVGVERGVDWVGGSVVVGVDGYPVAGPANPDTEAVLRAEVDPAAADDKRLGAHNHVFDDRRPHAYG